MASKETLKPSSPFSRQHRSDRGSVRRGKLQMALVFLILRAIDAWYFFHVFPRVQLDQREFFPPAIAGQAVFTTALVICVGFRQAWAHYLLVAILLLNVLAALLTWPLYRALPGYLHMVPACLVDLALALWCIRSRDIQRLVSRRFE